MARKYEYKFGRFGWAMERCEEKFLIAGFYEIERRVSTQLMWKREFLDHFFNHGNGVTFETLAYINSARRRHNLDLLEFTETTVYEYARSPDRLYKSEMRRQMRDEFVKLDTAGQVKWKTDAMDQVAALLPPHLTHNEWKGQQEARSAPSSKFTQREQTARAKAHAANVSAPTPAQPKQTDVTSKVIRQLRLAKKPETIARIIAQLSSDDALTVAESGEIEGAELIDALVARSLDD